jgi:DNA-3-methyladenine glycosylase I
MNDDAHLVDIFKRVEKTLIKAGIFSDDDRLQAKKKHIKIVKRYDNRTDDDYFLHMCNIIFFSGFRSSVVEKKMDVIKEYFGSYLKVASYTEVDYNSIMSDQRMIRNQGKIKSIFSNSKLFVQLIEKYGSFKKYLESFGLYIPESLNEIEDFVEYQTSLDNLSIDLISRFAFLGPATVNHFLTDLGFPVLKPDRMIMRLLFRTHLVNSEHDLKTAIIIGQRIAICSTYQFVMLIQYFFTRHDARRYLFIK